MSNQIKPIAYYLPQYHPIPENDAWWGKGFTEWTNVTKAKPLFKGHKQPKFPADLGYYDLRVPEVREAQAAMAKQYGLYGFCYYHYWFGNGRRILERPFNEVLASNKPDFPFSLCWANQTWSGIWFGESDKFLIKQEYPGREDELAHFKYLFKAFSDPRYICVDGKPFFEVYMPDDIPDIGRFVNSIREEAHKYGFPGLYLVATRPKDHAAIIEKGFDATVSTNIMNINAKSNNIFKEVKRKLLSNRYTNKYMDVPYVFYYEDIVRELNKLSTFNFDHFPLVVPNWDNTPRSGKRGHVFHQSTPALFKDHFNNAIDFVEKYPVEKKFVMIKAWNEWAEGNHLEPDKKFGYEYLETVKQCLLEAEAKSNQYQTNK